MKIAEPVLRSVPAGVGPCDSLEPYEAAVIRLSLAHLATFPWIAAAVADGRLALHGCWFDISNGVLARLEDEGLVPVA
jgi:carbonic anhydrase